MYIASILLLLLILPTVSILAESAHSATLSFLYLTGRWYVFWAVGVRLFIAGIRQVIQPKFTAQEIFNIHDPASFAIVKEIGCANLAMGFLGICTLFNPGWIVPTAIVGGLYYGLAGALHISHKNKNAKELTAMISDEFIFAILLIFVIRSLR